MGINIFPVPASGGVNDFILDKNNSINNTFILGREFAAGGYSITTSSTDSSFDVYLINAAGSSVGYTNGSAIVASEAFDTVVFFGIGTAENVQFSYSGPSTNATTSGQEVGAAPFLTSIFPADLPNIDDTATVAGGNFSTAVQITFESGTVVKSAKNIVVGSSTALVVTRPDDLIEDLAPYNLRAVNPGVTQPTGSNVNILTGTVTAGADPSFITSAGIYGAKTAVAFSTSILVSDSDGTVVNWAITAGTIPPGLSLATATGAISGTPTTNGDYFFTVRITDDGGNTNSREFNLPVGAIVNAPNSTATGGYNYLWWTASGTGVLKNLVNAEYLVIAGGGGGGSWNPNDGAYRTGGGGAGGLLHGTTTLGIASAVITIGAGGAGGGSGATNGDNTILATVATATGGGRGGASGIDGAPTAGANGGSGGGAGIALNNQTSPAGGTGISGQGNNGAAGVWGSYSGGGGGAGTAANAQNGGNGLLFGAWATAVNKIFDAGYFAGGGHGRTAANALGTSGLGQANSAANSGGGGDSNGTAGGSGMVIVRYQ